MKKLFTLLCLMLFLNSSQGFASGLAGDEDGERKDNCSALETCKRLEERFPVHFKGFGNTDFEWGRYLSQNPSAWVQLSPKFKGKYQELSALLIARKNPQLGGFVKELGVMIKDPQCYTPLDYAVFINRIALSISNEDADEKLFFKLAGFPHPYELQAVLNPQDPQNSFLKELYVKIDGAKDKVYFSRTTYQTFFDPQGQVEEILKTSPFMSFPYYMPCQSSILGFFYLAMSYNTGLHPIPVPIPLKAPTHLLHGAIKTPWGEVCHDEAHSDIDPADHSVRQFSNNLLNHYLIQLKENLSSLSAAEKGQYCVKQMIPPFTTFALTAHNLYRECLVKILENSVESMDQALLQDKGAKLPPEFKAFSVAAFMHAHEEPTDMSRHYTTDDLSALLKSSLPKEKDGSKTSDTLFQTSYITGETILSDEALYDLVKHKPFKDFERASESMFMPESVIPWDDISRYTVERNKFFIEVTINMIEGQDYVYRQATNFSSCLNFEHDRQILRAARTVLKDQYGYTVPKIPTPDGMEEEAFEVACADFRKILDQGTVHLRTIFLETATKLSHPDISGYYAHGYQTAVAQLADQMPPFVAPDTMLSFIRKAVEIPALAPSAEPLGAAEEGKGGDA